MPCSTPAKNPPCHVSNISSAKRHSLFGLLVGLLRKLHSENQVPETVAVHALARPSSICAVCVRDESKALGAAGLAVLGQEDTSDTAVALEDLAEVVFFGEFGDLVNC